MEMTPKYLFSKDKIKEHRQAMESRVKKLAQQAVKLEEKEKEWSLFSSKVNQVVYGFA